MTVVFLMKLETVGLTALAKKKGFGSKMRGGTTLSVVLEKPVFSPQDRELFAQNSSLGGV